MKIFLLSFFIIFPAFPQSNGDSIEQLIEKMRIDHQQKVEKMFNQFFNDDFFRDDQDPFAEMKRMREMMQKRFNSPSMQFDNWFEKRLGGGTVDDISREENDKSITFKVRIDNIKDKKVDIKVENGMIVISGETDIAKQEESDKSKSQTHLRSSFHRSFPVPTGVDEKNADIKIDGDLISITLPKNKQSPPVKAKTSGRVI